MLRKVCLFIFLFFTFSPQGFAETLYLKSGKKIEGKIIEKTDTYVKVDFYGSALTYFLEDVDRIEGENAPKQKITPIFTEETVEKNSSFPLPAIIGLEDNLIREALDLSGAELQIKQFSDMVLAGAMQSQGKLDEAQRARLVSIIREAYRPEKIYSTVISFFKNNFKKEYLSSALSSFKTPLFKKILQLEKDSSGPGAAEKMQAFFEQLKSQAPNEEKVALFKELNAAIRFSEFMLKMNLATIRELTQATLSAIPSENRPKELDAESLTNMLRQQLEPQMEAMAINSLLFTYQTLTNNEIQEYITFYKSAAGQWFNNQFSEGMLEACTTAARQAGKELIKIMQEMQLQRQKQNKTAYSQ